MAEGSRTFRGAGEENERRKDERQDQPATRAPPHRRPVARGTLAPWSKRARQLRRDEAILFILFGASGNRAQVSRPCHNVGSARAPRDQDQGPSTRRFSQARARVANLPPGVRTPRRGDSRISRAAIADGRPTTPPRDPHGANDRRVQRRPRWGAPPPTRAAIPTRRPAAPPRATGRHANARRSAGTSASPRRSADRTRSASATPSTTTNGTRARAPEPPVVRPSRSPARASETTEHACFSSSSTRNVSSHRLFSPTRPPSSLHRRPRREKERLREAKRFLKRRRKDPHAALIPSAVADAAAAVTLLAPTRREREKHSDRDDAADPAPLTASQIAARKVAAARAAAFEEDATLARFGAPRENLLAFRADALDAAAAAAATAATAPPPASAAEARRRRRDAAERLEELAPRATGREALIEKRRAVAASNREMAAAKEESMWGGGGGVRAELGGGDDFGAALAASRRAREARERRRGADPETLARRTETHMSREVERMRQFHDLVGGMAPGERLHIPRRDTS